MSEITGGAADIMSLRHGFQNQANEVKSVVEILSHK